MANDIGKLKDTIEKELLNTSVDLAEDYAQIGLDELLDNEAFKSLPIVKTLVSFYKGGLAIREIVLAKKLAAFFRQFHNGLHSQSDMDKVISKLQGNHSSRDKIIQQVVVMIDRYVNEKKAEIHANLLLAHLTDNLTWDEFDSLIGSLDMLHPKTIDRLREFKADIGYKFPFMLMMTYDGALIGSCLAQPHGSGCRINELGRKFCIYGLR